MKSNMLKELLETIKDKYPPNCAEELLETEKALSFSEFNSQIAMKIGNAIVDEEKIYNDVTFQIVRASDDSVIYQYIGDTVSTRNIEFAKGRVSTSIQTGHCSY